MTLLLRPSVDAQMLDIAEQIASRGTCSRAKVGAVLPLDSGRALITGRNGAAPGEPHCRHRDDTPCSQALHAEANLIGALARTVGPDPVHDGTLYCTHAPCLRCARLMLDLRLERVVYRIPYRLTHGLALLTEHGVRTEQHT